MPQPIQGALSSFAALCVGKSHAGPTIEPSSFARRISVWVEKAADDGSKACYLQNVYHGRYNLIIEFARKALWGPSLLLYGELIYIPPYWEWTEWVLASFDQCLRDCSLYYAVYASLYSYSRDAHVLFAFYKSWCPYYEHPSHPIRRPVNLFMDLH